VYLNVVDPHFTLTHACIFFALHQISDNPGDAIPSEDLLKEIYQSLQQCPRNLEESVILQTKQHLTCPALINDFDNSIVCGCENEEASERMPSLWELAIMPTNLCSGVSASETSTASIGLYREKEEVAVLNVAGQDFSFSFV
jgi:hypothetical protein